MQSRLKTRITETKGKREIPFKFWVWQLLLEIVLFVKKYNQKIINSSKRVGLSRKCAKWGQVFHRNTVESPDLNNPKFNN